MPAHRPDGDIHVVPLNLPLTRSVLINRELHALLSFLALSLQMISEGDTPVTGVQLPCLGSIFLE